MYTTVKPGISRTSDIRASDIHRCRQLEGVKDGKKYGKGEIDMLYLYLDNR